MASSCNDEYEKFVMRMTTPRVVIENDVCPTATIIKVVSARKHRILLDSIQILMDLNLSITKAYISSDGCWSMDVFHVTDLSGNKLADQGVINIIQESLCTISHEGRHGERLTVLELTGTDRVGLLSEVFAVLADLQCCVVDAKVWTHNGRIASLTYVKDCNSGSPIQDLQKIDSMEARLQSILRGDNNVRSVKTSVSIAVTQGERRLHQMMFADRDYERDPILQLNPEECPLVTIQNWVQRSYSMVSVQCKDRPKLLFDIVCTLTDMEYVVFHATIDTACDRAYLEFYTRHVDGTPISSEAERLRVIQCLKSAIERRVSESVRLELCTHDRPGLLAEVTRTFRENGLNVTHADISTVNDTAQNTFHVTDANGYPADPWIIESVCQKLGPGILKVKELPCLMRHNEIASGNYIPGFAGTMLLALGSLVRKNLYSLGLIKSCS